MNKERSLSWQTGLLLPFAAGFIGALISIAISTNVHALAIASSRNDTSDTAKIATATGAIGATVPKSALPTPSSKPIATNEPIRLIIPSIGLDAAVQSVGLSQTGDGAIGTPNNATDVAWYNRGPVPGTPGIAIIDGHLDTKTVPEAVFYTLGNLAAGESIYVKDRAGIQERFVVTSTQKLAYNADTSELFASSNTPQLALITCAGDWMPDMHEYTDRIVVFATLANSN